MNAARTNANHQESTMLNKTMNTLRRTAMTAIASTALVLDWAVTAVDYGCIGPVAVFLEVFKRRGVEPTIEEARDVGMIQPGKDLPFLAQAAHAVAGWKTAQQLDRDLLIELPLDTFGKKYVAHAAGANLTDQAPRAEPRRRRMVDICRTIADGGPNRIAFAAVRGQ